MPIAISYDDTSTGISLKQIKNNPNIEWTIINLNNQNIGDEEGIELAACLKIILS
ncbi:MAG: hypothetical protein DGJ47_001138 [Rickettsiaceae bacterium]